MTRHPQNVAFSRAGWTARRFGLRRIAAIVALAAPVAMVAVAVVALAGDVPIAVLAAALVLVANAAVWFALTERGARRAFGALAALLASAGLVVVLATHWQGVLVLIALVLLLALFGLAARYALGRTGRLRREGSLQRACRRASLALRL